MASVASALVLTLALVASGAHDARAAGVRAVPRPATTGLSVQPPAPTVRGYMMVRMWRPRPLYRRPGGPRLGRWTSDNVLRDDIGFWVIRKRGRWLGISAPVRNDNRLVWINGRGLRRVYTWKLIEVDLSSRRLTLWHRGRRVWRVPVAVGRPSAPTPVGLTSVHYQLHHGLPAYFGPRVLALGMRQPAPSPGFPQGGIMALHGTDSPGSIGAATSAGCVRLHNAHILALSRRALRGTPVVIHR